MPQKGQLPLLSLPGDAFIDCERLHSLKLPQEELREATANLRRQMGAFKR